MPADPAPIRLPLRVTPYADENGVLGIENFNGFMHRLAVRNHHDSPGTLFSTLLPDGTFDFPCSHLSSEALSRLATMSGIDVAVLRTLNPELAREWTSDHHALWQYLGACFHGLYLEPQLRRVCPECLADEPYDRGLWGLLYIDACAFHGCALIHRCPICERRLRFHGPEPTRCTCGFDLRHAPAQAAAETHRACAAFIVARLSGKLDGPDRLATMEVGQACDLANEVGMILTRAAFADPRASRDPIPQSGRETSYASSTAMGFALIAAGDHALLTKVGEVGRAAYSSRHPGRKRTVYGQLQPGLPIIESTPMEALVREAAAYLAGLRSRTEEA